MVRPTATRFKWLWTNKEIAVSSTGRRVLHQHGYAHVNHEAAGPPPAAPVRLPVPLARHPMTRPTTVLALTTGR
jgi:hypothetical protein